VEKIRRVIESHRPMIVDYHALRTRRSGSEMHVDFHVVVCRRSNLQDAHQVADRLEKEVARVLGNAHVVTHIDPCGLDCPEKDRCQRALEEIRDLEEPETDRPVRGEGQEV
jgi:divalent metal cation (Fe/Co/Zn/Cd) transporter